MNNPIWTADDVDFFVHLYKQHQCLWNIKIESFDDNNAKKAAYDDIASKMLEHKNIDGLGVQEIKDKFSKLLTIYYQSNKNKKSASFSASERSKKWFQNIDQIVKCSRSKQKKRINLKSILAAQLRESSKAREKASTSNSNITKSEDQIHGTETYNAELQEEMDLLVNNIDISASSVKFQSRIEIMNVLKKLYKEKVAPNLNIMFDILTKIIQNDDKSLTSSFEGFKLEMTRLGYLYKETIDGKQIIVENAEQRFERYLYLTKIRKVRSRINKSIVYIDERVINKRLNCGKIHNLNNLPAESSIFFHAITNEGLCSSLFVNQASEEDFNKWVTDILLGCLKKSSTIIMDNGPIHGRPENSCTINIYSTKHEMLKWLNSNNIPCSSNLSRPEIYELIRKNRKDTKEYKIDRILRSHGHEVLRLPNSFPDLNMTDILWNACCSAITDSSSGVFLANSMSEISYQAMQHKILEDILPSINEKQWNDLERVLVTKENDIYEIDTVLESILDTYIFM